MIGQKFDTPENALAHFGKKGMKWGVRNEPLAVGTGPRGRSGQKKITDKDIEAARLRDATRHIQYTQTKARVKSSTPGTKAHDTSVKKMANMEAAYLRNPDRATALRMTKGEKYVSTAIAVALPGAGTIGVAVGSTVRVGVRKHVERSVRKANA